ncbi:MAG: TetR/AcrR family transcriptional regulator [Ruminococcus sp.]|nr:TetR/AcrR family transcriptional regulator [Ruminococcus sp.]
MNESGNLKHNPASAEERIDSALVDLIRTCELSKITVSMVAERAQVSKSTFYRYYYDIYDVYENLLKTFAEKCLGAINSLIHDGDYEGIGITDESFF